MRLNVVRGTPPARTCGRQEAGALLIEVLMALWLVALLSVATTRLQWMQWRVQRTIAQIGAATTIVDAWAQARQMRMRQPAWLAATEARARAEARARLPQAIVRSRAVATGLDELSVSWSVDDVMLKRVAGVPDGAHSPRRAVTLLVAAESL